MNIIKVTKDNFQQEVIESEKAVLIDFWAPWCGPCKMQAPVLDEVAAEYDSIKIGKLNIDDEQVLAFKFGVTAIPTMLLFKDGEVAQRIVGFRTKDQLVKELGL